MPVIIESKLNVILVLVVQDSDSATVGHFGLNSSIDWRSQHKVSSARFHEDWKHERIVRVRDLLFIYVQRLAVAQKLSCLLFRLEILEK